MESSSSVISIKTETRGLKRHYGHGSTMSLVPVRWAEPDHSQMSRAAKPGSKGWERPENNVLVPHACSRQPPLIWRGNGASRIFSSRREDQVGEIFPASRTTDIIHRQIMSQLRSTSIERLNDRDLYCCDPRLRCDMGDTGYPMCTTYDVSCQGSSGPKNI